MDLQLRPLRPDHEREAERAHAQMAAGDFAFLLHRERAETFGDYLRLLDHQRQEPPSDPGRVPATLLIAEAEGTIVGRSHLRHRLSDGLEIIGGHVGFGVLPAFRGRGYGTRILELSLARLAELGVATALVTCGSTNGASRRVIERCGGRLEDEVAREGGGTTLRYRIPTRRWSSPHEVSATGEGLRLVDYVKEHLAVVATREVGPLIARTGVQRGDHVGWIAETIRAGDELCIDRDALDELAARGRTIVPAAHEVPIVFEDDDLIVVDKPAGMHVHPMGRWREDTLVGAMLWHAGARPDQPWAQWRPYPGHRLDRPTSGLMTLVKSRAMQDAFRRLLDDRKVERTYHAEVIGEVDAAGGVIDAPLGRDPERHYRRAVVAETDGGQAAVTHWRVIERRDGRTLLEVTLETGRTHQIRAHLASIGHPILDDSLYEDVASSTDARPESALRIALRAVALAFPHPRTGEPMAWRAEGPV